MWEAVYSNGGKPWSETYNSDEALREGLTRFYYDYVKLEDEELNGYCDVQVYNDKGEDYSESQFIQELIGEIMEDDEE